ncbi:MAG TPA: LysR family transcriptional regulator substrate-binding protein, partial [Acidiferrobacteraceae bacterium]|nr:LysR family transcriptional regulator substrate-binding protein [Acidiferrobacteraceae bacterium]
PRNHPLALKAQIALADLAGVKMIERCHCEFQGEVANAFARYQVVPDIVARAQNEEWALALAGAGVGVALVPESSVRDSAQVVVRPLALKLLRRVGLAYDPAVPPSPALRAALALCRETRA